MNVSITYRKHESKWEYRLRFKDPITKKIREKSKRGFRTKPEAKLAAEKIQRELQEGYEQTDMMLKSYLDFWMEEFKEWSFRLHTITALWNIIDNHVKPYFKSVDLKTITPGTYQKFLNHLAKDKELARNTILNIHNNMFAAMKQARINKMIVENPCENAVIPKRETNSDLKFIESSEVANFLSQAFQYGYIYWVFFKLLIETGMRKGEAAALQWSDINMKAQTISISKSLDFQIQDENELFGETKNKSSVRTITISKSLTDALRFHMNYQNQNKLALNDIYRHDLNLVLCRNDGHPMPKSSLFNAFSRILKRADIKPLPIHSLRHTHAVLLLESGADMKYVQERLGHGSYQITADVYSHVSKKMEQKNTAQFEAYMDDILN